MLSNQELKSSTHKELLKELKDASDMLIKTRITVRTKHEKDTSSVQKHRRYVAKIKTIIKEMELEEMVKNSKKVQ